MKNGFYADTVRLRQHSIEMYEERRIAELLHEQLGMLQKIACSADTPVYGQLMEQSDKLVHYFDEMSKTVEDMGTRLEQLSQEIGTMLKDKSIGQH